ncbi:unnamed protein product, partial [Ectocarpus fasciculatus]
MRLEIIPTPPLTRNLDSVEHTAGCTQPYLHLCNHRHVGVSRLSSQRFLKAPPNQFPAQHFHDMFKTQGRAKVEEVFATCCAAVPTDALRKHLLAMAPSPEAFLTCRGGFARSLATLNACSYVLGIGDRHLDNFLLDTTTGTVVGIDFGAAFGIAHTELGVPELIPFRLTNQFQNLLQPLDSVGLLKGHMVSTLQALRGGREVLLATMDVFLNEPVMDWISEGVDRRQAKTKRGGGEAVVVW